MVHSILWRAIVFLFTWNQQISPKISSFPSLQNTVSQAILSATKYAKKKDFLQEKKI